MCAPTRYTTRQRSVKRIFSFSSGTLNRLGSRGAVIRSARDRTARLLDLRAGGGRHRHTLDAELALDVPHAEQLDGAVRPATQPRAEQRAGRHLHPLGEPAQVPDVHDLCRLFERVGEAALRDAADERHLAAFEPGPGLTARARGLALPSPAGGLTDAGAGPATLADAGAVRAGRRPESREREHPDFSGGRLCPRGRTRAPRPPPLGPPPPLPPPPPPPPPLRPPPPPLPPPPPP